MPTRRVPYHVSFRQGPAPTLPRAAFFPRDNGSANAKTTRAPKQAEEDPVDVSAPSATPRGNHRDQLRARRAKLPRLQFVVGRRARQQQDNGQSAVPGLPLPHRFGEPLGTVPPQRFEQPIPQLLVVKLFDCQQRLVHELLNMIERIALGPDCFDSGQIKAAGENRQPSEQFAFLLGQQIVAPVDRRSQCLMSSTPSGQKPESIR